MNPLCDYFFLGFLFSFIGPLANLINIEIDAVNRLDESKKKKILFEVTLRALVINFFPILYLIILIDYLIEVNKNKRDNLKVKEKNLTIIWNTNNTNSLRICEDSNRVYFVFFMNIKKQLVFGVPKETSKNKDVYSGLNINSLRAIDKNKAAKKMVELIHVTYNKNKTNMVS
jgi:hypothetical protein